MEEDRPFYVYIVASGRNGTLYIGHTDDIVRRAWEHAEKVYPDFTRRHGVGLLVWYEMYSDRGEAFTRERQMKKWNRAWKLALIERTNPGWRDLAADFNR
ncbi:MAG: nuclease [Caulobacter sp.]|nr:nuclease [Caulobacter sp.]